MERPEENAREKPEEDEIGLDVLQKFGAQTTQHTCYNISTWDYLHRSKKRIEMHK